MPTQHMWGKNPKRPQTDTGPDREGTLARDVLLAAFLALVFEFVHIEQRVAPAIEAKVPAGALVGAVVLTLAIVAWKLRDRPVRDESPVAYLLVAGHLQEAAKRPLPEAIEAVPVAACQGLKLILGDWVRWSFEVNGETSVGLADNRSCWAGRVEGGQRLLVFSTGSAFTDEAVEILEEAAALVDLLLTHNAP